MQLDGDRIVLRRAVPADVPALVAIRSTPEVRARWRGDDLDTDVAADLVDDDKTVLVILDRGGEVIGGISWYQETEADYRHAGIDVFLSPDVHGQGLGTDAVRTLAHHLISDEGHHRLIIDPAADNAAAIRCYTKVGFRPVGLMRQYERGPDGQWHDGLLMDLLADELTRGDGR
ncbi:MAG: GNAT family N-acetyltransferase [Acidimicrobiales bacterium]